MCAADADRPEQPPWMPAHNLITQGLPVASKGDYGTLVNQ